jgi:hypothetical protein
MTIQFWSNDPTIIFNKNYIFELWPSSNMCYEQKLNAITRIIILVTILGYILTTSIKILFVGLITVAIIFALYKMRKQQLTSKIMKEGFTVDGSNFLSGTQNDMPLVKVTPETLGVTLNTEFDKINKRNPFSNVLLTDIMDNPDKKAAPPSFNVDVDENITKNIKKTVQLLNPGINNTNKQLYGDLWENFELDQSNRVFFSTANTRVTNDQTAFAKYLYGNMPSGKSSGPDGDFARVQDNYRYTMY